MDLVFSTDDYAPSARYAAWRDAICDVYVHVDVKATDPARYRGFIREAKFGGVVLTDILLSEQRIRRSRQHISRLDKECYYLQLLHKGSISVLQCGETQKSNAARGAIFSATEEYELYGHGEVRSFYLEIPRDEFAQRFPRERIPVSASLNTTQGLGRIATEFCATLATEGSRLEDGVRAGLGNQLMDLLAFSLLTSEGDMPAAEGSVKRARLRSVQQWIEAHLSDSNLSLERIAAAMRGLLCLLQRGTWGELAALNRPAILVLTDRNGRDHQVVLDRLRNDSAELLAGETRLAVPLGELLTLWYGEYLLLWRPEAGNGRVLSRNATGSDVLWLRRTLGEWRGTPILPADSSTYDAGLEAAVREFQRSSRLAVDGIAGAMTMIALNNALELPGRPRLREED